MFKLIVMIELNIIEIFSTVAVGLAVSVLMAYFYFLFCKFFFVSMYNENAFFAWLKSNLKRDYSRSGYSIVMSLMVYSLGVLASDITDHMTDSDSKSNSLMNLVNNLNILEKQKEIRKNVLFKSKRELSPLGKEIFGTASIEKISGGGNKYNFIRFADYFDNNGKVMLSDSTTMNELNQLVNRIYYDAKNWCYLYSDAARNELNLIQHHIDFARSISIISIISLILIVIFFLFYLLRELIRGKNSFLVKVQGNLRRMFFYPRLSLLVLTAVIITSKECYYAAEKNFDERAYGYYITFLKLREAEKNINLNLQTVSTEDGNLDPKDPVTMR